ncbi:MAG: neutral/alkaline ceramidase [Aquabacterium sp.]|nr:neutral/alkaline ceramidase [Aquabacterium sp.]
MRPLHRLSKHALALAMGTLALAGPALAANQPYQVGVGMSDITGEAAEVGMMGYAELSQKTSGIHQRLRARAFIVQDAATQKSAVIVITDTGLVTQAIHQAVLKRLAAKYGALYNEQNVLISATHTHAGPGGYSHYALYNITILGFQKRTFNAIVDGIIEAIDKAHLSKAPGDILLNQGELTNASRNRSALAFRLNPASDRAAFPLEIDPLMSVLTFRQSGKAVGALSLFPTHGTSMTNKNTLISGDNKGYAAYHWEHEQAGVRYRSDKTPFVAAFGQTNPGDMSPNLNLKPGSGPTDDEFENTRIIGQRQADKALQLSAQSSSSLQGAVDYRMRYVNMSQVTVSGAYTPDGQPHTTCPAALGTSFAAGSEEDGPGPGVAKEGQSNPFLAAVGGLVFWPSESLKQCHGVKEVVIPVGEMKPYPWVPEVLPLQLVRLGSLYLATLPGEPTVMSGYRIRRQLAHTLGVDIKQVLVVGYTNAYTEYITTPEEYSLQDYEGGSTLFGPYTQPAYQQELNKLAYDMATNQPTVNTLQPRDLSNSQLNFQTGVVMDLPAFGKRFGQVLKDVAGSYAPGDTVRVRFQTGHPKNNLRRNGTFLEVQRLVGGSWQTVADDGDWATRYRWVRTFGAESAADISWTIPAGTPPGSYRIVHYGDAKNLIGTITPFTGTSGTFQVTATR